MQASTFARNLENSIETAVDDKNLQSYMSNAFAAGRYKLTTFLKDQLAEINVTSDGGYNKNALKEKFDKIHDLLNCNKSKPATPSVQTLCSSTSVSPTQMEIDKESKSKTTIIKKSEVHVASPIFSVQEKPAAA